MRFREQFLRPRSRGALWWARKELVPYREPILIHRGEWSRSVIPDADGWVDVELEPGDVVTWGGGAWDGGSYVAPQEDSP